jgi:hypothetical protein
MKTVTRLALMCALALGGCTADYARQGNAPVLLLITNITPNPMSSEVLLGGSICPDFASVSVVNLTKNPNFVASAAAQTVIVNRYEVSYFRSDGRATQGVDVPYAISGTTNASLPIQTGADSAGAVFPIEVVRRQAKMEPPLVQLRDGGGQAIIVTMQARITVYGQTIAGENVSASGTMQIDFADYVDTGTAACPTS